MPGQGMAPLEPPARTRGLQQTASDNEGEISRPIPAPRGGGSMVGGRGSARAEGVAPAEPGEAGEVGVGGDPLAAMLDGQGGVVRVGHQLARGP